MRAAKQNRKLLDSGEPACPAVCPVCSEPCVGGHGEVPEHHYDPLDHEWSDD